MAGLLSLAMAVTMITPAGSTVYASTLDDEQLTTVETQEEAVPEVEVEVPADDPTEVSEAPEASEVEVSETTEDQAVEVLNPQTLSINDINTIQAVTDMTMYGQGLTEVIITYREGVDVSKVTAANYVLEDRGSLSPDYAKFTIDSVTTEGQTVTLIPLSILVRTLASVSATRSASTVPVHGIVALTARFIMEKKIPQSTRRTR